ncbi:hypothetical protein BO71DRAFT_400072 [Aspergillus ellipticus CBS 707.79]|uniref:Uncharacterized protein n=1 Tax=Aspergillus ellipticus CBS 707.79 TaxID=1448320 RepID=A0A319D732_9EURO|nr:hypothetical protein BO71DRAFT_400072 [Aspergillus ellipticus CBS 707.79]
MMPSTLGSTDRQVSPTAPSGVNRARRLQCDALSLQVHMMMVVIVAIWAITSNTPCLDQAFMSHSG